MQRAALEIKTKKEGTVKTAAAANHPLAAPCAARGGGERGTPKKGRERTIRPTFDEESGIEAGHPKPPPTVRVMADAAWAGDRVSGGGAGLRDATAAARLWWHGGNRGAISAAAQLIRVISAAGW